MLVRILQQRLSYLNLSSSLVHWNLRNLRSPTKAMTTIAVLNESDLKNGEMKQVDFQDGKVLVSRLGDKVHATSAFCTHYGAPLANGVLSPDGRVVCPWHGACFNVCTGDIEDSPGLNAIHSFKAEISGGKIHVTADPKSTLKENKARSPTQKHSSSAAQSGAGVVIVGGGAGGLNTAESLRENGYAGKITILSAENYAPIDRTKLSKALIGDASKVQIRTPDVLKNEFGVDLKTVTTVASCDFNGKTVSTSNGDKVPYETLVLATGGIPRRLPIDGAKLSNVYTLRHVEDAKVIDSGLFAYSNPAQVMSLTLPTPKVVKEGKKMVVIGSSFIGMELVAAVSKRNLSSIDVIGMEEVPFEMVLGKEVGKGLMTYHEKNGVKFHMKKKIGKIVASSSDPSIASAVEIEGKTLEADVIIMGVGVAPATEYLKSSGLTLERDGGVSVDEYMRVKGQDNVFAIGDIAHYPVLSIGEVRRIEHWNVASNQGRAVGKTISGTKQAFVKVPIFWSAQGGQLRYCGSGVGFDDVIVQGNPADLKFIAYYTKGGNVIAVASMGNDPVVAKSSELMRLGLMTSGSELKSGKSPLDVSLAK